MIMSIVCISIFYLIVKLLNVGQFLLIFFRQKKIGELQKLWSLREVEIAIVSITDRHFLQLQNNIFLETSNFEFFCFWGRLGFNYLNFTQQKLQYEKINAHWNLNLAPQLTDEFLESSGSKKARKSRLTLEATIDEHVRIGCGSRKYRKSLKQ